MSKSKQHMTLPDTEHLSLEQMQAYLDDTLPGRGMHQVERHLLDCELCSDAFEGLSAIPEPEQALDAVAHIKKNIRKKTMRQPVIRRKRKLVTVLWKPMSVAASILILLTAVFIILRIDRRFRKPKEQISMSAPKQAPALQPGSAAKEDMSAAKPEELITQNQQLSARNEPQAFKSVPFTLSEKKPAPVIIEAEKEESIVSEQLSVTEAVSAPAPSPSSDIEADLLEEETAPALPRVAAVPEAKRAKKADEEVTTLIAPTLSSRKPSGISQSSVMIYGTVISESFETPLAGVTVTIKGSAQTATTDEEGKFKLLVPLESILVFNYIGYNSEESVIKNQEPLKIKLTEDIKALNEVAVVGYGTEKKSLEDAVFTKPLPVKGYSDFRIYMRNNLRYPETARKNKIEGNVRVEFWVNADSTLSDFTIKKGLGYGCDEEAIRLIKEGPAWKPGLQNNVPTRQRFIVIVPFKLKEEK
ncbi:TonB family protein [Rhodocytophaga rosea]|uniref:TonB family protein n=1 Tax=Rhodocytophaga rosea TaxID=2704465 RepID=A0A6C0GR08_9BACT|nr:TonB family protein [Rhodocytophaga rosea]QHT70367.1 TonB family protein [Rhodocytophaga rosea]